MCSDRNSDFFGTMSTRGRGAGSGIVKVGSQGLNLMF